MVPSILALNFDLFFGCVFAFWCPNGWFLGLGYDSKTFFESTHIAEQLLFSMLLWFLTFIVDLILGSFMAFWGPMGLFFWLGKGSKDVLGAAYIIHRLLFSRNGSIWALIYILNVLTHFWKFLKRFWRQTDRPTDTQDWPIKVTTRDLQFFGYIHIDRKLLFSMLPSILTFNFCLILGSFFGIWGPNGRILGFMKSSKTFWGSICIAEQLLFSILP